MDVTDLQTFRAVVACGGVGAAARQLHRVQSSISARLAGLERSLGCRLFERQGKRLVLTPEGRHLHERSAGIVDQIERLRHELAPGSAGAVLRIGAMESTAAVRLAQPLVELRRACPQLQLTLKTGTTGALLDALARCELDAVFVAGPSGRAGLVWQAVFVEELVMITPRQAAPVDTLVTFSTGCAYREVALAWSRAQARPMPQTVEIGSYHALVASVAAGMGCGVVPRSVLQRCDAAGVRVRRLGRPHDRQTTWLVTREQSQSEALGALRRAVGAKA